MQKIKIDKTNMGPLQSEIRDFVMENKEMEKQFKKYFSCAFTKWT